MTALERRSCGSCTACCVTLKIDTTERRKKSGVPCRHRTNCGCGASMPVDLRFVSDFSAAGGFLLNSMMRGAQI
jgi:hypothetical protein